jgi:CRP/FNR family transcriptional regulator
MERNKNRPVEPKLREQSLFKGISELTLGIFSDTSIYITKGRREVIYSEGDSVNHLYLLVEGMVSLCTPGPDGTDVIRGVVRPGQLFGEMGLAGEKFRGETAYVSRHHAHYFAISLREMNDAMNQDLQLALRLLDIVALRLTDTERHLSSVVLLDSESKLVHYLTWLAERVTPDAKGDRHIYHTLTHEHVARIIGASRQFVTSMFNDLRRRGIIDFDRSVITVHDMAKLKEMAPLTIA